eukprot:3931982-Rhodomonas_salina.1
MAGTDAPNNSTLFPVLTYRVPLPGPQRRSPRQHTPLPLPTPSFRYNPARSFLIPTADAHPATPAFASRLVVNSQH